MNRNKKQWTVSDLCMAWKLLRSIEATACWPIVRGARVVSAWDQLEGPFVMAPVPPGFKMVTVRCQWQQCQWPSKFPSRSLGSAEFGTHCHSSRPNPPKSHLCPWMSSVALGVEFQQRRPHNNNPYWIQLNQKKNDPAWWSNMYWMQAGQVLHRHMCNFGELQDGLSGGRCK